MYCRASRQEVKISCPPLWFKNLMVSKEWVFRALGGRVQRRKRETLLCSSREEARLMLGSFSFAKLQYHPNSYSVFIFWSHFGKKWSYYRRDLPWKGFLMRGLITANEFHLLYCILQSPKYTEKFPWDQVRVRHMLASCTQLSEKQTGTWMFFSS